MLVFSLLVLPEDLRPLIEEPDALSKQEAFGALKEWETSGQSVAKGVPNFCQPTHFKNEERPHE